MIRPAPRAFTVSRMASPSTAVPSDVTSVSFGPQTGQAIGWAWKRLLSGSSYSALQSGHIGKPAMAVWGRS